MNIYLSFSVFINVKSSPELEKIRQIHFELPSISLNGTKDS